MSNESALEILSEALSNAAGDSAKDVSDITYTPCDDRRAIYIGKTCLEAVAKMSENVAIGQYFAI